MLQPKQQRLLGHLAATQKITDGIVITASIPVRQVSGLKIKKEFHTERLQFKQIVCVMISILPLHCVLCI